MSKESAEAALGKFAEAVNTGKLDLFDQVVASNCVDHDPADGQVPRPRRLSNVLLWNAHGLPQHERHSRDDRPRRGHHRHRLHPHRHAHRCPRKGPAHRQEGQNPRNADLQIQRRQDGRTLGKLRRVRHPKADRCHPRLSSAYHR
jgi:hypothetical protein